jgi:hypothetical protein
MQKNINQGYTHQLFYIKERKKEDKKPVEHT